MLSKVARLLGRSDEAEKYEKLSGKIKKAFNSEFFKLEQYAPQVQTVGSLLAGLGEKSDMGEVSPIMPLISSQTSNLLPLYLDMVPEGKEEAVLKKLLMDVESSRDCHVGTGIVGTRYLFDVLTRYGRADLVYKLTNQTTYPSWGYMIKEGATTLWERWEYYAGAGMNSHNHIMLGSVDAWLYKVLAGINMDSSAPGFERIIIKPHIVGDLKHVSASVNTIRGLVASSWRKEEDSLLLKVTLPVNSKGKVSIPDLGLKNPVVKEGEEVIWKDGAYIAGVSGIFSGKRENGYITLKVGSGVYSFRIAESP